MRRSNLLTNASFSIGVRNNFVLRPHSWITLNSARRSRIVTAIAKSMKHAKRLCCRKNHRCSVFGTRMFPARDIPRGPALWCRNYQIGVVTMLNGLDTVDHQLHVGVMLGRWMAMVRFAKKPSVLV
jgi:hypothetical protein